MAQEGQQCFQASPAAGGQPAGRTAAQEAAGGALCVLPFAAGAMGAALIVQNMLLLQTARLLYACELVTALELFASLCLLFAAVLAASGRRLFALVLAPALVFVAAVTMGAPFNALTRCTNALIGAVWIASGCLLFRALQKRRTQPATVARTADAPLEATAARTASVPHAAHALPALFSAREQDVIGEVLAGKTVREAADALCISSSTVKTHLQHIYEKAGVKNRASLAAFMQRAAESRQPNG